jgi:hypothetical protein
MQSDIEIYVKNINTTKALQWLQSLSWKTEMSPVNRSTTKIAVTTDTGSFNVYAISSGKFISLWFQSGQTPWQSDLACAQAAWQYFAKEVRASQGGWQEDSKDERWWKIDADGESLIDWPGH